MAATKERGNGHVAELIISKRIPLSQQNVVRRSQPKKNESRLSSLSGYEQTSEALNGQALNGQALNG